MFLFGVGRQKKNIFEKREGGQVELVMPSAQRGDGGGSESWDGGREKVWEVGGGLFRVLQGWEGGRRENISKKLRDD